MHRSLTFALAFSALTCLPTFASQQCEGLPKRDANDFVSVADGSQVFDKKTNLIWMRCVEDQSWNNSTCVANDPNAVNPGPRLTYQQAKALAAARATAEEHWRIPTRKELLSLREPNCYNPSLNLTVFPTKPAWSSDGAFWTSTPEATGVALVSAIGTSDAWATTDDANTNHVRLVRTPPESSQK